MDLFTQDEIEVAAVRADGARCAGRGRAGRRVCRGHVLNRHCLHSSGPYAYHTTTEMIHSDLERSDGNKKNAKTVHVPRLCQGGARGMAGDLFRRAARGGGRNENRQ